MRRIALALLVALASPLLMGAGALFFPSNRHVDLSAADGDALDSISAYMNGITTLKGSFIQIEPSGNVDEGRFYVSKPGRMRFEYAAPVPTLLVSDGRTVAVANTRLNTVDRYPIFLTPLDVILGDSIDFRHDRTLVGVEHREDAIVVNLRANRAHTRANISLVFSVPEYQLRQWTVIDDQGLSTTVALRDVIAGGDLPASLFVLPDKKSLAHRRESDHGD